MSQTIIQAPMPTLFFKLALKPTAEESRVSLYADQIELRAEICGLGVLDSFIVAKQHLSRELASSGLHTALSASLQNLVNKVQPMRHLIFHAAQPEKDIAEMQGLIEELKKSLHPVKAKKLLLQLTQLAELYRGAQKELEKDRSILTEKYACCLVGITTGFRYIPKGVQNQLMPIDAKGEFKLDQKIGAMRPVHKFGHIFWKLITETTMSAAPLAELAYHLLGKSISRHSSAPTEVQKLITRIGTKDKVVYIQASKEVEKGISLREMLEKYPDWVPLIDPEDFALCAILDMFALPHDGKPENVIAIPIFDAEKKLIKVHLKVIDADLWGAHPVCRASDDTHFVWVRSIFFCLPQMNGPIHPKWRKHFSNQNQTHSLLQWLLEICEANRKAMQFENEGHINAAVMEELQMPFYLLKEMVPEMHEKLIWLRSFMRNAAEEATYMDLFKRLVPQLAHFYDLINKNYSGSPLAAFMKIFISGGPDYEETMKPYMQSAIVGDMPLEHYLKGCNHANTDFETQRNTPPEKAAEELLTRLDFSTHSPDEQLQILNVLKQLPLEELTLRRCTVLHDDSLLELVRALPGLSHLSLLGSPHLTLAGLQAVAAVNPQIELTLSECPGISLEDLSTLRTVFPRIISKDHHEMILERSGLIKVEMSSEEEMAMQQLVIALEAGEWQRVGSMMPELKKMELLSRAKIKIVEKLISNDVMRGIVKKHALDVLEFILHIGIPLSQKNTKGDTLYSLCIEEDNDSLLSWLCAKNPVWQELKDKKGQLPIHIAANSGKLNCLEILIKALCPLNTPDKVGRTPLCAALESKQVAAFKKLASAGADITATDMKSNNLMHTACQFGLGEALEYLLENARQLLNKPNNVGRTPIFTAAESNQVRCCQRLLALIKLTDLRDGEGWSPAQVAARAGAHDCMILLMGDKPEQHVTKDGKTLLHLVTISGQSKSVTWLCRKKVSVIALDERKMSAAHYAATTGQGEILEILFKAGYLDVQGLLMPALRNHQFPIVDNQLLKHGAVLTFDEQGMHPIHCAAKEGDSEQLRYFCTTLKVDPNLASKKQFKYPPLFFAAAEGHEDAVKTLLSLKANINAPDSQGKIPLHQALLNGREAVARLMILQGADVAAVMSDGSNSAHYAAAYTRPALLQTVLDINANLVNRQTEVQGHTPLHQAMLQKDLLNCPPNQVDGVRRKQMEVIITLLRYGANINAIDRFNFTALHLAVRSGRDDFVRLLLDYGADPTMLNKDGNTPEQHGKHFLDNIIRDEPKNEPMREAIKKAIALVQAHGKQKAPKKTMSFIYGRSLSRIMHQTYEMRQERLWKCLEEIRGFPVETIRLVSSLVAQWPDLPEPEVKQTNFRRKFDAFLKKWEATYPQVVGVYRATLPLEAVLSPQQASRLCFEEYFETQREELALRLPFLCSLPDVWQKVAETLHVERMQENQIKALCQLLLHFQKHEAFKAEDFPPKVCLDMAKRLQKLLKGNEQPWFQQTIEFLKQPQKQFPEAATNLDWMHKNVLDRQNNLLSWMVEIFDKASTEEREAALDTITLSLMKVHADFWQKVNVKDLRPNIQSHATAWDEMTKCAAILTENCLKLLLTSNDVKQMSRRLECMIEWVGKCLLYGDYHQAFAIYKALTARDVLRVHRSRKHLSDLTKKQLNHFEQLFLPSAHYQNYQAHIEQRFSPCIPAISICTQFPKTFGLCKYIQDHRAYAKRLILQTPQRFAECAILISHKLFPQMDERYLWEQSLKLQPPK